MSSAGAETPPNIFTQTFPCFAILQVNLTMEKTRGHLHIWFWSQLKPKHLIQSYKGMNACHCFASIPPPTTLFMFYIYSTSLCKLKLKKHRTWVHRVRLCGNQMMADLAWQRCDHLATQSNDDGRPCLTMLWSLSDTEQRWWVWPS